MSKILYINGNPNPTQYSSSRKIAEFILDEIKKSQPEADLTVRDLYTNPPRLIDETYLSGLQKSLRQEVPSAQEAEVMELIHKETDEFMKYDRYVIATPMWNFGVPPLLKAYVDCLIIAGKTFRYTATGPLGLLKDSGRKLIIVEATGGIYNEGANTRLNHCSRYLEDIFSFIGLDFVKTITVSGTAIPPFDGTAIHAAKESAKLALKEF